MLEAVTLNLVAAGLTKGVSGGTERVRDLLRRRRFSEDVDDLATEFNTALRDAVAAAVEAQGGAGGLTADRLRAEWDAVAAELDRIDAVFEDEADAVLTVTDAVAGGLGLEPADAPEVRGALEAAVADAYRDAVRAFAGRIAGTELADVLAAEADVELRAAVGRLDDRLAALREEVRRGRDADLRGEGFVRLSPLYFRRREPEPPERCWRTGFELVEVDAGYAVPREGRREDGSRYRVAEALAADLLDGEDCVLLGPPGSGKSTVCKRVACSWHAEDRGPVFYRASGQTKPLTDPGVLAERVRAADGHALVVVEDAVREEADGVFRAIADLRHDDAVSFLLDARAGEWNDPDASLSDARLQELKDAALTHHSVPRFDERECERVIERFEATTGATVGEAPGVLLEEITGGSGVGAVLGLSYHLSVYASGPGAAAGAGEGVTALEKDVENAVARHRECDVEGPGPADLPLRVGILVNLLNAADVGVYPELVHALAAEPEQHRTVGRVLDRFDGSVVFAEGAPSAADATAPLRTHHEFWSTLYLGELLETVGEREAVRLFEACLDDLFGLFDDPERRRAIERWFRAEMPYVADVEAAPEETARSLVGSVFGLGRRRPALAPLFGRTEFSAVDLPAACPAETRVRTALWRGITYYKAGDIETADAEFEAALRRVEAADGLEADTARTVRAWCRSYLGILAGYDGDREAARETLREAREAFRAVGDRNGEAHCLFYIGEAYREEGRLEEAERRLSDALALYRDLGDRGREAVCRNMFGLVCSDRGEYDAAEDHLEASLELSREVGARRNEARTLNHLGLVALSRGRLEEARTAFRRGLKVAEWIGDRQGRAYLVHNLGDAALAEGDLAAAEARFRESLELEREIGNPRGEAISHNYLGDVARKRGDLAEAERLLERGLELVRTVGDRRREAELLKTRGKLARDRGDLAAAEDRLEESLGLYRTVGDRQGEADVLRELGGVARKRGDLDAAAELCERSLEICREIDDAEGVAECLGSRGMVAQRRGDHEAAGRRYRRSLERMRELGDREGEAYALMLLGDLARERGDLGAAAERFAESHDAFAAVGDRRRRARLRRKQGRLAREAGDLAAADTRLGEALSAFREVGDRFGAAETLAERGRLARERGDPAEAEEHLRAAVERFRGIGVDRQALSTLEELIELRRRRGADLGELRSLADALREGNEA